jgi:hypothetical protein
MALKFAVNNSLSAITILPSSISGGALNLISTQTASASATIDFTSGIDSTYDSYVFKFINIHPATDAAEFQVNFSTDGGSNYNVTKTTTYFQAYHGEGDASAGIAYEATYDLAQGTGVQRIFDNVGNDNDQNSVGTLTLFNPSSTTYVKHFIFRGNTAENADYSIESNVAGYCNTTSAVNAVRFSFSAGNIDDGIIKMYGVS